MSSTQDEASVGPAASLDTQSEAAQQERTNQDAAGPSTATDATTDGGSGRDFSSSVGGTATGEPTGADALPTTPMINGDTIRRYLNTHVSGPVMAGLKKIGREQPANPVRALGEFLIQLADSMESGKPQQA